MMRFGWIFFFSLGLMIPGTSLAKGKNPIPRFVSLRSDKVNVRVGPGYQYPLDWTYTKAGLPVEVVAEFDTWRQIRDNQGTTGWVHQTMLSPKRRAMTKGKTIFLHGKDNKESLPLARLEEGVNVELLRCQGDWCQVRIDRFKGWIERVALWGVYSHETLK